MLEMLQKTGSYYIGREGNNLLRLKMRLQQLKKF